MGYKNNGDGHEEEDNKHRTVFAQSSDGTLITVVQVPDNGGVLVSFICPSTGKHQTFSLTLEESCILFKSVQVLYDSHVRGELEGEEDG